MSKIDWTKSMQQTFEFYEVDPLTWEDTNKLDTITTGTINRDLTADTLGSSSMETTDNLEECYVRTYLIAKQNNLVDRIALGTHLMQTPGINFNGRLMKRSMDGYTPLIELKEKLPPIGYSLRKGDDILSNAYTMVANNVRAPVDPVNIDGTLDTDFVSEQNETCFDFVNDLLKTKNYGFKINGYGRITFYKKPEHIVSLKPIIEFNDGNSSILQSNISVERDLWGIPNVVEVIYSRGSTFIFKRVVNDLKASPVSTFSRGREIVYRTFYPDDMSDVSEDGLEEYAKRLLTSLSDIEYKVTYTHGFCNTDIGDCVLLNYRSAGITNVRAMVISQKIDCKPGCQVEETAIFTDNMWERTKYELD